MGMSGRCRDCRYWLEGNTPYWWDRVYPGTTPPGLCDRIEDSSGDLSDKAAFISTDGDAPWLYTKADFGCTAFAAKERQP